MAVAGVLCRCNAAVILNTGRAKSNVPLRSLRSGDVGNQV